MTKFLFPLLFLFIISCNTGADSAKLPQADSDKLDGTQMKDTPMIDAQPVPEEKDTARVKPSKPVAVKSPRGVYQAVLPCGTGCRGIQHTIAFYPDRTYRLEEQRWDKDSTFTRTTGFWSISNGLIWLYKEQILAGRYQWQGNTLLYLQGDKPTALRKLVPAAANKVWKRKKEEGLTFFGVGNEPFWSIEIDEQKSIAFYLAEWTKPVEFKPVPPVSTADSTSYNTTNDSATLHVVIYNTFCSDGMSDYIYNNKVKVAYNNLTYSGCGIVFR